jgi:hypothetical protein
MIYDRDLRFTARVLVGVLLLNLAGAIVSALSGSWGVCAGFLIWTVNANTWRTINRHVQFQRDRNRLIEAAVMADWERRRP